jgi:hypothetical protein
MTMVRPLAHVVLSGSDYDRIEFGLRVYPGFRIFFVKNANPRPEHREHASEVENRILQLLSKFGYEGEQITICPIDFFKFDEALVSLYELFLKIKRLGMEAVVNVSGGTKPAAAAAILACALTQSTPVYFAAKEHVTIGGEVVSKGVIEEPITIGPLFELSDALLPRSEENIEVMLSLLEKKKAKSVTEIIQKSKKPTKREIAKYAYYVKELESARLVRNVGGVISLTDLGQLVAKLIRTKKSVEAA